MLNIFSGLHKFFKRTKRTVNTGRNNKIILIKNGQEYPYHDEINGLVIHILGNNNKVILHYPIKAMNSFIFIASDNSLVDIGTSICLANLNIDCNNGTHQQCIIGPNTTVYGMTIKLCEKAVVNIGADCMFSNYINIWASDGHSIIDIKTGKILNHSDTPVIIGNHVWIGEGVKISKKTHIHDNCIVGMGAICTKDYKKTNVIIAGNPAKIIRENVNWDKMNPYHLQNQRNAQQSFKLHKS